MHLDIVELFQKGLNINESYAVLLWFVIVTVVISICLLGLSVLLSFSLVHYEVEKVSTYECGFVPFGDARMTFEVGFYVVSLLFVIFDLEVVFLFPWAITSVLCGSLGVFSLFFFLLILTVGFAFEWLSGALEF